MTRDFKIIAIDFDGTIAEYDGWKGVDVFGEPIEGAVEAIQELWAEGHKIIIYTCRVPSAALHAYLQSRDIPYDSINCGYKDPDSDKYLEVSDIYDTGLPRKIHADVYIDDRGISFEGNWEKMLEIVKDFKPWGKRVIK